MAGAGADAGRRARRADATLLRRCVVDRPGAARRARSRWAAGPAPTTPRSPAAPISRSAWASGGRRRISTKASCCGAASASTTKAACSTSPRAARSRSRIGIGALVVFCYLLWLAQRLCARAGLRGSACAIALVLLLAQVALGIGNVKLGLPLPVATAHNGVAALLLFTCWSSAGARAACEPDGMPDARRRGHRRDERVAEPVPATPDQAARRRADRVHRGDRHVPRGARACRRCARAGVRHARHLAGGGVGRGDQPSDRPAHRRADGAHLAAAAGDRRADAARRCWCSRVVLGALSMAMLVRLRQPADRAADVRLADRLRGRLHRAPQARDAAEHRDRRRSPAPRRRCSAGPRSPDAACTAVRAAAVPDHLRVDAAAFLGAGDLPPRRLRARAWCRCCR